MKDNDTLDKMVEQYVNSEDDAKAYLQAQKATIITQTRQINEARKKIDELSKRVEELTIENTRLKATNPEIKTDVEDAESIAVVQLALLNSFSMQRELTLEEVKKYEIHSKILHMLKGKKPEESEGSKIGNLSNEELIAAMKTIGEG